MSGANERFQLFNIETMSGVYPGTRTQRYQRLRLEAKDGMTLWAQLLWYDEPPACVLYVQDAQSAQLNETPLLLIPNPQEGDFSGRLQEGLATVGLGLRACGSCVFWQPSASQGENGIALGSCGLRRAGDEAETPPALTAQSLLALDCPAWAQSGVRSESYAEMLPQAPLPRIAVITESKLKPWRRWARRLGRKLNPPAPPTLAGQLAERSGVGAGTEPCLACHGRIANLGALTVESGEGDKQTFSVWRCRQCASLYLSNWIDRWERVESLETEETLYRIAPVEAAELLALFAAIPAGDHPLGRRERAPQRDWILAQIQGRAPVSHIIKQGR